MKRRLQRYLVHTEILSTFHARVEYISVTEYAIESNGSMGQNILETSPSPCSTRTLSNTPMPGLTQLTTPNDNYATKSPLVTMGRPKFTPKTAISPSITTTPSNAPIPRPTPLTIPNGIRIHSAILPQYTFRTDRPSDTQTDRWAKRQVRKMSAYAHYINATR